MGPLTSSQALTCIGGFVRVSVCDTVPAFVHVCLCICECVCVCVCVCVRECVSVYLLQFECISACVYVCYNYLSVCLFVSVCTSLHLSKYLSEYRGTCERKSLSECVCV